MKTLCAPVLFLCLTGSLFAEIDIPKDVLRMKQYEEALKQGAAQKKPVALVLFDEEEEGSKAAKDLIEEGFKAVKGWSIVVFVSTCRRHDEVPDMTPPALGAHNGSTDIKAPKVIVISPREDIAWTVIGTAGGKSLVDIRKTFRQQAATVKQECAPYFAAKTPPPFKSPGDTPVFWATTDGKLAKGPFLRVDGDKLFVKAEGDKEGAIELSQLKPASVRYAKALAGLGDPPAATEEKTEAPGAPAGPEKWTNSKGKEIEATFVKLENGKVTLRLATGKDHVLALNDLSAASQARAKELAGGKAK